MSEPSPESILTEVTVAAAVARIADGVAEEVLDDVRAWWRLWRFGDLTDSLLKSRLVESIFNGCDRGYYEAGVLSSQVVDDDVPIIPQYPATEHARLTMAVDTLWSDLDVPDVTDPGAASVEFEDTADVVSTGDTTVTVPNEHDEADIPPRLKRLATAEPTSALQEGMRAAYRERGAVGYRRGLDADPCELCTWLYKDGYIYPIAKNMHKHPGCQCYPIPVFEGDSEND